MRSTNGLTSPQCAPSAIGIWLIGSCRHLPGSSLGDEVDADARLGVRPSRRPRAAPGSRPPRARPSSMPRSFAPIRTRTGAEVLRELRRRSCGLLRREQRDQRVVRRLRDGGAHRRAGRARRAGPCSFGSRRRSRSPRRRSRCARSPSRGSRAPDRAARRRRASRRARPACGRARSRRSRPRSSGAASRGLVSCGRGRLGRAFAWIGAKVRPQRVLHAARKPLRIGVRGRSTNSMATEASCQVRCRSVPANREPVHGMLVRRGAR